MQDKVIIKIVINQFVLNLHSYAKNDKHIKQKSQI
jgi:hypothetical protein